MVEAGACSALVGDYQVTPEGVSTARLCAIEREAFAFAIDLESTSQQPDLETYYELANPELKVIVNWFTELERLAPGGR